MNSLGKGVVTWSFEQYRSNAEKEYDDFWKSLFRELIQNANDAGSKEIRLTTKDGRIGCIDDGSGMSLETITKKLLVIGGSFKDGKAVGGLGKAKELIFFSQPRWVLATRGYVVEGTGGEYEIFEAKEEIKGTAITLYQPDDSPWLEIEGALSYVADRCQIAPKLIINGGPAPKSVNRGKMVRDLPEMGHLYHAKTCQGEKISGEYYVHVRVNGCWMFDKWVGSHTGRITLDIDSDRLSPLEGLSANRDSLKFKYASILDRLVQEIAIDKTSALVKRDPIVSKIRGDGDILTITDSEIDQMVADIMSEPTIDLELLAAETENFAVNGDRLESMLKQCATEGEIQEALRTYSKIINYEPDFIVYEDPENSSWNSSRVQKFLKTQKASTIAQVWTETVKQVCLDNKIRIRFTAGFMFDDKVEAMHRRVGNNEQYLINPRLVPPTGIQNKVVFMNYMRTTAIHEIAHREVEYHDENFMSHYHELEANTWNSHRVYARIGKLR